MPAPHSAQEALSTQSHSCRCTVPVKAPNRRRSTATVTRVAPIGTGIMPNLRRPAGRAAPISNGWPGDVQRSLAVHLTRFLTS